MRYLTLLTLAFLLAACGTDTAERQSNPAAALDAKAIVADYNTTAPANRQAETWTGLVTTHYYSNGQDLAVSVTDENTGNTILYGVNELARCNDCQIEWDNAQVLFFFDHLIVVDAESGRMHRYDLPNQTLSVSALQNVTPILQAQVVGISRFPDAAVSAADLASAGSFNELLSGIR